MKKRALIAVLVVVAIVAVAGFYSMYRGMRVKAAQPCWGKLVNIQAAKEQWSVDTHGSPGAPVALAATMDRTATLEGCLGSH